MKEKLRYDGEHLFDVENLVFAGIGASFDQLRDRPSEWGQGWGPFSERYASHLGSYLIQRSIMFPVQAIDHEDTRYFPSTRTSVKGRIGDAFLHTIWRHNDSGGMMPAYSEFLGDYGAAAASRMWWPAHYHDASSILIAGTDTVLIDAGINVFHELTPDIKRWLHLTTLFLFTDRQPLTAICARTAPFAIAAMVVQAAPGTRWISVSTSRIADRKASISSRCTLSGGNSLITSV